MNKLEKLEFKKEMSKQALLEVIGLDEFQLERLIENKEMVIRELNKLEDLSMEYFEKEFEKLGYVIIKKEVDVSTVNITIPISVIINRKESINADCPEFDEIDIRRDKIFVDVMCINNNLKDLITKFQKWYWSDK